MSSTIILIDGQNLYYSLKNLAINEWSIKWDKFLKSLLEPDDRLIRTYWFRPLKISDTSYSSYNIRQSICLKKYNNYFSKYKNEPHLIPKHILNQIEKEAIMAENWLTAIKEKFTRSEHKYDQFSLTYEDIEVIKTGMIKVNPYKKEILGEKGVDISLAVKMISLSVQKRCDKIILISGDYDYAEAIKFAKDNMIKIHLAKFYKGHPPKNKSVSRDLAILVDKIINIYETDLESHLIRRTA